MVSRLKLKEHTICDAIRTWGWFLVAFSKDMLDITWLYGWSVKGSEVVTFWRCGQVRKPGMLCKVNFPVMTVGWWVKLVGSLLVIRGLNIVITKSTFNCLICKSVAIFMKLFSLICHCLVLLLPFLYLFSSPRAPRAHQELLNIVEKNVSQNLD